MTYMNIAPTKLAQFQFESPLAKCILVKFEKLLELVGKFVMVCCISSHIKAPRFAKLMLIILDKLRICVFKLA